MMQDGEWNPFEGERALSPKTVSRNFFARKARVAMENLGPCRRVTELQNDVLDGP